MRQPSTMHRPRLMPLMGGGVVDDVAAAGVVAHGVEAGNGHEVAVQDAAVEVGVEAGGHAQACVEVVGLAHGGVEGRGGDGAHDARVHGEVVVEASQYWFHFSTSERATAFCSSV